MNHLLIIDPQNDFCDIAGAALPVAGADADLQRLSRLIQAHGAHLDGITVTLDSHASVAVERTTFWQTALGDAVAPFTFITAADVRAPTYCPRDPAHTTVVVAMLEQYPLSEHFGVFEADAPAPDVASTQFNTPLAQALTCDVDLLLVAGEASSHCVAASFDQLAGYLAKSLGPQPRIVVLRDCMSPVTGFESASQAFFERVQAFGAELMTAAEAGALLA